MISLFTGLPGNGKTLRVIREVLDQAARENRPVFYHGISELTLPWELLDDPKKWASVPPGAIVVIDEAQKTFRNRALGSVPPDFVTDLETHRHLGIDLYLLTQHPSLIDPSVRRLSGRHSHMVRMFGMEASTVHTWPSVKDNCDKSRADSEKSKWIFDKSLYGCYKSAEVHTMKRSIPFRVKLLMAVPFLVVGLGYMAYLRLSPKKQPAFVPVSVSRLDSAFGHPASSGSLDRAAVPPFDPVRDAREYVQKATPRVTGLAYTAPKYDELTRPSRVPIPAACIATKDRCKCYSQQGTPMDISVTFCRQIARDGFFREFDPDRVQVAASGAGGRP